MSEYLTSFDLSNPQHLAMRKVMADVYSKHANAKAFASKKRYEGMSQGLERVALYVLRDHVLHQLCFEMSCALADQQECLIEVTA